MANEATPLVGEPLEVHGGETGKHYNPDVKRYMVGKREWSDNLWDCTDPLIGVMSVFCPCVVLYQTLGRSGPVKTPCGILDRACFLTTWLVLFALLVVLNAMGGLGPVVTCVYSNQAHGGSTPIVVMMAAMRHAEPPFAASGGLLAEPKPEVFCTTVGHVVVELALWALLFLSLRGVRELLHVRENEAVTCLKASCWPDLCLCCQPCFVAQVARHVDRAQGFKPPLDSMEVHAWASPPAVATPVGVTV